VLSISKGCLLLKVERDIPNVQHLPAKCQQVTKNIGSFYHQLQFSRKKVFVMEKLKKYKKIQS
jgi:hypothetical protein